jgi:hypothetical protein
MNICGNIQSRILIRKNGTNRLHYVKKYQIKSQILIKHVLNKLLKVFFNLYN